MPSERHRYQWGALELSSRVPLPELPSARGTGTPWTVRLTRRRAVTPRWFHHWEQPGGHRWLSFGRDDGDYVLRFARSVTFRISPDACAIVCHTAAHVPPDTIRHLLLNQVLPLVAGLTHLVLHASAIRIDGRVIGLVGEGGAGKSTLAAALCRRGAALVSDDALILDRVRGRWVAIPCYPSFRLWPASVRAVFGPRVLTERAAHYTGKRRVDAARVVAVADRRAPLTGLCLLEPRRRRVAPADLTPIAGGEALVSVLASAFQIDVHDRARLVRVTEQLANLVESVPVYRLRFSDGLGRIESVADQVRAAFGAHRSIGVA